MNCLCCGKQLKEENEFMWHKSCIKHFFDTPYFPDIEISEDVLQYIITNNINKGLTIPGVQKKLSLHLSFENHKSRLTLVDYPTGYILKPQVNEFKCLPEAEHLVMSMADKTGISTVPHALIKKNGIFAYITKRIDRVYDKKQIKKIAMEDFCQLDMRLTADKYKGSYERCAKLIKKFSGQPGFDLSEIFIRLVFSFVVGNSDMHLKNFSLIENNGKYVLSKAYDLLPVNIILSEDKEEFALTLNGKKTNIRKKDFVIFAKECGISEIAARKMIQKIVSLKPVYIDMVNESYIPQDEKQSFINLINDRCKVLA